MTSNENEYKSYDYKEYPSFSGFMMLGVLLLFVCFIGWQISSSFISVQGQYNTTTVFQTAGLIWGVGGFIGAVLIALGFIILDPNEHAVVLFCGQYRGVVKSEGFYWINPFTSYDKVSVKVENFETETLKVNDGNGNPIQIAAVIVWRVSNAAQSTLTVDSGSNFAQQQSEGALRGVAGSYPYEIIAKKDNKTETDNKGLSLRGNRDEIEVELVKSLKSHLSKYGIHVANATISKLSYAPEIAATMLQRQQAEAVVAARAAIVTGAIGIVDDVIAHYSEDDSKVELDKEAKNRLVTNLLVTLTSGQDATPVVPLQ